MKKILLAIIINMFSISCLSAQSDSTFFKRQPTDTSINSRLNMDAVYNRPFLQVGKIPVALGGYVESKVEYMQTDGITEGYNFKMQRMTLFVSSSLHRNPDGA